ncbi:peptidoglycan-binding protein [Streptomyces sp. ATCC 21386]|uniref:peptidoglycan-binding domain-containing protein n=1 Tax=Streptomyces sp. ATCC 21386 TaxID=2699428 RepID=UPI001BFFCA23|nr:peptidoglycan-binding domain-containing protein [Streptomyces sp. ATCC 21386]
MKPTLNRCRTATALVSLALLAGVTGSGVLAAAPNAAAATVYACNVTGGFGPLKVGYYSGSTVIPSTTQVTAAGKEAQCLLKHRGYNPGAIDGVFGATSRAAAKDFQESRNELCDAGLAEDGSVGPKTWPWLRFTGC